MRFFIMHTVRTTAELEPRQAEIASVRIVIQVSTLPCTCTIRPLIGIYLRCAKQNIKLYLLLQL
jgi:hypothetical protein